MMYLNGPWPASSASAQGCIDDCQSREDLENYSLERLTPSRIPALEEHLLVCAQCRAELDTIEPCNFVHHTPVGPFYARVTKLRTGGWYGHFWGWNLDIGKEFRARGDL
jgi:hypothetical protein